MIVTLGGPASRGRCLGSASLRSMFSRSHFHSLLSTDEDFDHNVDLILRDHLALVRTRLANESTLLSYIRSSLYLLIGGMALINVEGYGDLRRAGYVSLSLSALFIIIRIVRYHSLRLRLKRFYTGRPRLVAPGSP